jgi:hypothetical protein
MKHTLLTSEMYKTTSVILYVILYMGGTFFTKTNKLFTVFQNRILARVSG